MMHAGALKVNHVLRCTIGLLALIAGFATFVTKSVVPEQLNNMALIVKESKPDIWEDISSKLNNGERIRDRPDLISIITATSIEIMKDETEDEYNKLITMIKKSVEDDNGEEEMESLREPIEATIGCTIEEFCTKVDNNKDSKFLTDTRKELAKLLQQEFLT